MFNKIFTGLPEHRTPQLPACVLSSWFHKRLEKKEKNKTLHRPCDLCTARGQDFNPDL